MSYDIFLKDPVTNKTLCTKFNHEMTGGTYAIGGTNELWLNITYNYARWYYHAGVFAATKEESKGIRTIYGKSGAESIPILRSAIAALQALEEDISEQDRLACISVGADGYWMPTKENAIRPLYQLLSMAYLRPDGIWDGD
mgnify:CR=1 FL=1